MSDQYCVIKNIDTNVCHKTNTNTNVTNNGNYNYAEKCGYHYINNNWVQRGRCPTSSTPCCSAQSNGYCGKTCTLNRENDYIAPAAPVTQSNCGLTDWSTCSAPPVCTKNAISTSGTQTRQYIQTPSCTIPVIQATLSQSCGNKKDCEKCGRANNNRICSSGTAADPTKYNNCCSSEGLCGRGPDYCKTGTQWDKCADKHSQYTGYANADDWCSTRTVG